MARGLRQFLPGYPSMKKLFLLQMETTSQIFRDSSSASNFVGNIYFTFMRGLRQFAQRMKMKMNSLQHESR